MKKCIKCQKDTDIRLSPDLDISGIPVCSDCKDEVGFSLMLLAMGEKDWEWFEKKYKLK